MTLRARLTAAFLAVVLGPVLLGAVFVGYTVGAISQERAAHQLDVAAGAARSAVAGLCQQLRTAAGLAATPDTEQRPALAAAIAGVGPVSAVQVRDGDGIPTVTVGSLPSRPWADCDSPKQPDEARPLQGLAAAAPLADPDSGQVWAVAQLDASLVERLAGAAGVAVTVRDAGRTGTLSTDDAAASSVAAAAEVGPGQVTESTDGRWVRRLDREGGQPLALVLATPRPDAPGFHPLLSLVVGAAGVLAVLAAWRLGRSTTRPLTELAHATEQVAEGDLSVRVPVRGSDEAGRLAATFNRMTHRMQLYVQALTASRDQLRRQMSVLGDTLSGTHDLNQILRVILQTALATTAASRGAVVLVDEQERMLIGHATEAGGDPPEGNLPEAGAGRAGAGAAPAETDASTTVSLRVPPGEGLLGGVAATGEAAIGRVTPGGPARHESEPDCRTYVVVPITAPGGAAMPQAPWPVPPAVRGVLALYDRLGGDDFDESDLAALRTFASQAGVAVDNVRTHLEAQRLSLTDPLTGLWNYRYLTESIRREVERASRFRHPLAVLVLDLDRFKDVNDAYGHPAGDAVLTEFARRTRSVIREVDLAFRHGGEEFAVILPETDARGATVLAERLGAAVRQDPMVPAPRAGAPGGIELAISITVSIGIAVYPEHSRTPSGLLEAADDALYAAKAAGRDTYRVATPPPEEPATAASPAEPEAGHAPESPSAAQERSAGGAQPPRQTRGR